MGTQPGCVPTRLMYRESLAIKRKVHGDEHPQIAIGLCNLGALLRNKGDLDEAEKLLREAVRQLAAIVGEENWYTASSRSHLGDCLTKAGRYDEAERELLEAHRVFTATLGEKHDRTIKCVKRLTALYEAWGNPTKAAQWRAKLPEPTNSGESS